MESVELYRQLLGLTAPWTVERVELDIARQQVEVHVGHPAGQRFACPECGQELGVYDHQAERVWRHLDSCQFLTYLHARPPRVSCPEHGVRQVTLPWAQTGSRFTHLFEMLAIDVLLAANVKRAAALLRITWDEAWHLMERAVARGRATKGAAMPSKMVFDRFHIMQHVLKAVDTVRKQEHKALKEDGNDILTKSKYLWLTNPDNMTDRAREQFSQLKACNLKTGRAWALKEALRELWGYQSAAWATHCRLAPMIEVAKLIARHLSNVLTYFTHRVTNAVAEGLNSKIATVQKRACGYRNPDHFKIAVYFHCGGLNLYPATVTHMKV